MDASQSNSVLSGEILKCHFEALAREEIMADNQLAETIDVENTKQHWKLIKCKTEMPLKIKL